MKIPAKLHSKTTQPVLQEYPCMRTVWALHFTSGCNNVTKPQVRKRWSIYHHTGATIVAENYTSNLIPKQHRRDRRLQVMWAERRKGPACAGMRRASVALPTCRRGFGLGCDAGFGGATISRIAWAKVSVCSGRVRVLARRASVWARRASVGPGMTVSTAMAGMVGGEWSAM